MVEARYDAVADFYVAGWSDACDDPAAAALLHSVGAVDGLRVLDVACGHGRVARHLATRGAQVTGVDISRRLLDVASRTERARPLGVDYRWADLTTGAILDAEAFDLAVCNFGLSDVDDLDRARAAVTAALRDGGRFVASLVHPCFPGAGSVSGSWPPDRPYSAEGRWTATGEASSLRRRVGANHRRSRPTSTRSCRTACAWMPPSSPNRRPRGRPPAPPQPASPSSWSSQRRRRDGAVEDRPAPSTTILRGSLRGGLRARPAGLTPDRDGPAAAPVNADRAPHP